MTGSSVLHVAAHVVICTSHTLPHNFHTTISDVLLLRPTNQLSYFYSQNIMSPILVVRKRQKRSRYRSSTIEIGEVIPSDMAFVDAVLENQQVRSEMSPSSYFDMRSIRRSNITEGKNLSITFIHELSYRDEPIYSVSTTTTCDGTEIWGESSSCTLGDDWLRVKISNKAKSAKRPGTGNNRDSRDVKVFALWDLVERSGRSRQREMMEQMGSFSKLE